MFGMGAQVEGQGIEVVQIIDVFYIYAVGNGHPGGSEIENAPYPCVQQTVDNVLDMIGAGSDYPDFRLEVCADVCLVSDVPEGPCD